MRKDEIKTGFIYADPIGRLREVIGEISTTDDGQPVDLIEYSEPKTACAFPPRITRASFARWAKRKVGPAGSITPRRSLGGAAMCPGRTASVVTVSRFRAPRATKTQPGKA